MSYIVSLTGSKEILTFLEDSNLTHDWWTVRTKIQNEKIKTEQQRKKAATRIGISLD